MEYQKIVNLLDDTPNQLCVIIMSRTRFRVNLHSIVASLAKWLNVRLRTKWL